MMQPYQPTPVDQFGRDHVSLLLYCESRSVDYAGRLSLDHLRLKEGHPLSEYRRHPSPTDSPTRLRAGELRQDHDDADCLADLAAAGLVSFRFDTTLETFTVALSRHGWAAAQFLRMAKATPGPYRRDTPIDVDALDDHYSALLDRADPTDKELDRVHYSGQHAQVLRLLGEQRQTTDAPSAWAKWSPVNGPAARDYLIRRGWVERWTWKEHDGREFPELGLTTVGRAVLAELNMMRLIAAETFPAMEERYTGPTTAADDAEDQTGPGPGGGGA